MSYSTKRGSFGDSKTKKGSIGESELKKGSIWSIIPVINFLVSTPQNRVKYTFDPLSYSYGLRGKKSSCEFVLMD